MLTFVDSVMQCIIIFDHLNDIVFVNGNAKFDTFIKKRCIKEGLLREEVRTIMIYSI